MSTARWTLIHISLAAILSVVTVGVAESSGTGRRGGERAAMAAPSTRCIEDDFVTVAESKGTGLAATPGALADAARDGHVASAAAVVHIADANARKRALDALKGAMDRQGEARGLIGVALGTSEKCGSVRLLSVWQDESAMLGATTSSAFLTSMDDVASAGGTGVMTAWKIAASDLPLGWDAAREKIAGASPLH